MPRLSLSNQIFIGIGAGLLLGIFFGESTKILEPYGRIFVMLLQMPVLIFMFCSIVVGIGQLSLKDAQGIFSYTIMFLIGSWTVTKISLFILPLGFPPIKVASHFASPNISADQKSNFIESFIPQNPFNSFASGAVPAIVVFSIFFAIAVLSVRKRHPLLRTLEVAQEASSRIVYWITKISPLGVFLLVAALAGTITLNEFQELQYYYYAFSFAAIFVSLIFVPLLVTIFIPINLKKLLGPLKPALLLALSTGSVIVTLPLIMHALRQQMETLSYQRERTKGLTSTIIPLALNFPVSGKILNILFIYFVAWHYNQQIIGAEAMELSAMGILSSFGSSAAGITFLLNSLDLPADAINLFLPSLVFTQRLTAISSVTSIAALCFFTISSFENRLTFKGKTAAISILVAILGYGSWFVSMRLLAKPIVDEHHDFLSLTIENPNPFTIVESFKDVRPRPKNSVSILREINRSKEIRVGFKEGLIPFAYLNNDKELVGLDIELMHQLARDLLVKIVFVPIELNQIQELLDEGYIDIAISGLSITKNRIKNLDLSKSYMNGEHVLVVKDKDRFSFNSPESINQQDIKIAVLKDSSYAKKAKKLFSEEKIIFINRYDDFIDHESAKILYWGLPGAQTWSLINPNYGIIQPRKRIGQELYIFATKKGDQEFISYINEWIDFAKQQSFFDSAYNKWALGDENKESKKRWSIIDNVLNLSEKNDKNK